MPSTSPDSPARGLTLLYDGDCPLCSREIAWYRRRVAREPLHWIDVARGRDTALPPGVDRTAALSRFHVVVEDGCVFTGAAAFARLWAAYRQLAPLAAIARWSVVLALMELALRLRPYLTRRRLACPNTDP